MIGQREQGDAIAGCTANDIRRRQQAVGGDGMAVEIGGKHGIGTGRIKRANEKDEYDGNSAKTEGAMVTYPAFPPRMNDFGEGRIGSPRRW